MPDPLPDADAFKAATRSIKRAIGRAVEIILVHYYVDADVTLIFRNRKCVRVDINDRTPADAA